MTVLWYVGLMYDRYVCVYAAWHEAVRKIALPSQQFLFIN